MYVCRYNFLAIPFESKFVASYFTPKYFGMNLLRTKIRNT